MQFEYLQKDFNWKVLFILEHFGWMIIHMWCDDLKKPLYYRRAIYDENEICSSKKYFVLTTMWEVDMQAFYGITVSNVLLIPLI